MKLTSFQAVLDRRLSRRTLLGSIGVAGAGAVLAPLLPAAAASKHFSAVAPQRTDGIVLPRGYTWDRIAAWGDAMFSGAPSMSARDLQLYGDRKSVV